MYSMTHVHSGMYPACMPHGGSDVRDERMSAHYPRFRAAAAAVVEICVQKYIDSHSSGHNFACQRRLLPKLPRVCR